MNTSKKYERYERQLTLKGFGTAGQDKLFEAKVLVIGAGGLGCPALQYLTAAGVGTIGIVDFDMVELINLQRQILYSVEDIGKPKALTSAKKLGSLNTYVQFEVFQTKLEPSNALKIIKSFDVIIDGTDNFATRYLANDACVLLNKPYIYGAVLRFEGQVGVFSLSDKITGIKTNYRDLFPNPPKPETVPSCNEAGVLGVLPGIIGTMQATEAIKIITGIGEPLCNKIISYNALNNLFYEFSVSPYAKNFGMPTTKKEFENFNYEWFCGTEKKPDEISVEEFDEMRKKKNLTVIDVRETDELPVVNEFNHLQIPLSSFENDFDKIKIKYTIILFCQSGIRSQAALKILKEKYPDCIAYSLRGGIVEWKKQPPAIKKLITVN